MDVIKKLLLYAGLEKDKFIELLPRACAENRDRLKTYALVALGLFLGLILTSPIIDSESPESVRRVSYIVMAVFSLAMYLLSQYLPSQKPLTSALLCYGFIAALYAFSLVSSALRPEHPAVVAIAMMLLGSFLFTERPIPLIAMNLASVILLCAISSRVKSPEIATTDMWNSVVFGIIAIAAEITQEGLRFHLLEQADKIEYLYKTDLPTGCLNRNHYLESLLPNLLSQCKESLVCAYIDVNGLHNLNDTEGHDAGDKMLKAVAEALLDAFTKEHTYRVGGDEFIVMLPDGSLKDARQKLKKAKQTLAKQGYSISVGTASGTKPDLVLKELTQEAEKAMYIEKEKYYEDPSHERRRR